MSCAVPSWRGEHVAMGTNVDCYQRVEGRYRLMREIIPALTEAANPFSILTKGALILRDLDLLVRAAEVTEASAALSIGSVDRDIRRRAEPGAPPPARRLEVVRRLTDAGIPTGVLMAPVLPFLTDSEEQLDQTVAAIAASGAAYVSPDRAAPAAGCPGVVAGLAGPRATGPAPPLRRALRRALLRAPGLPGPHHCHRPAPRRDPPGGTAAGRPLAARSPQGRYDGGPGLVRPGSSGDSALAALRG